MKRLMVMAVTSVALLGCAASQYKFSCNGGVCDVETAGPATLDFQQEFGETLKIVETKDDRVTMEAGGSRATFKQLEDGTLGKLKISVKNIKGENAFFTVSE
jgi:ABC-type molybdate transport system substrate-binding protein